MIQIARSGYLNFFNVQFNTVHSNLFYHQLAQIGAIYLENAVTVQ